MRFFKPGTPTSFTMMLLWLSAIVAQLLFVINFGRFEAFVTIYAATFLFCFWLDVWSEESNIPFVLQDCQPPC